MILLKVLAICLISAVLIVLLNQYKSEYAFICAAAAAIVIFMVLLDNIRSAISEFYLLLGGNSTITYYFKVALKALGIAYIAGFTADMCRDFGQSSLAAKAEIAGKFAIFLLAVPLLKALLELALKVANV